MDPKSTKNRPKVNPKIEAAKHMFSDAFFNDFTWFLTSFSDQNQREFVPRVKYVEKRKTFQNIAWASKNQGFASPKWTKKARNRIKIVAGKKNVKKLSNLLACGASGARLGSRKREIWAHFAKCLSVSLSLCWSAPRRPNPFGKFFKGTQLVGKRSNMDLKTNQAKLLFPDAITDMVSWNFTAYQ